MEYKPIRTPYKTTIIYPSKNDTLNVLSKKLDTPKIHIIETAIWEYIEKVVKEKKIKLK